MFRTAECCMSLSKLALRPNTDNNLVRSIDNVIHDREFEVFANVHSPSFNKNRTRVSI